MSADVEQVMAQCSRGCFTGLLRVRTREGDGEVRFLSGIQDGIRFGSEEGDQALERLMAATEPEFEAISSLPPMDGSSSSPLPPDGRLETFHAAQLMRYCETNSLTCALELEVDGRVLTARYRLGELLSVEPDSEDTARLVEAKSGLYRFRLPRFDLPAGVQQRRSSPAAPPPAAAAAPQAAPRSVPPPVPPRSVPPPVPPRSAPPKAAAPLAATPAAPKPSVSVTAPATLPEQRPSSDARAGAAGRSPARPSPLVGMPSVSIGSTRPAARDSFGARPGASPPVAARGAGADSSAASRAPSAERRTPARDAEAGPPGRAEAPRTTSAGLHASAPAAPKVEAAAAPPVKPALEGLWADAVTPPPQSAPLELDTGSPNVLGAGGSLPGASGRAGGLSSLAYKPSAPTASPTPARSSSRLWLLLVVLVILALVIAGWFQLGR